MRVGQSRMNQRFQVFGIGDHLPDHCTPAMGISIQSFLLKKSSELTLVPRLSTTRVLIPQRLIQFASMSPAGPAPTIRTSTLEVGRVMM